MFVRNISISLIFVLVTACQTVPPVPPIEVSSSGTTVIHPASKDAIHIGDNQGNIGDIRNRAKTYYGDRYRVSFMLGDVPDKPISLNIVADSVARAGDFVCVSNIYVNDALVGEMTNGRSSYGIDVGVIKQGENQLTLVSESCRTASGGSARGIDDIVVISIEMAME